jgi:hypothetical protein
MTACDADPATDDLMSAFDFGQSPRPHFDFVPSNDAPAVPGRIAST